MTPIAMLFAIAVLLLVLSALVGLGLLLVPQAMVRLASVRYGCEPLPRLLCSLDRVYHIERFFYRHHRVFGGFLVVGSAYTLVQWLWHAGRLGAVAETWGPLADSATVIVLGGNLLGFALGAVVLLRPSLLKVPERFSNHWISIAPACLLRGAGPEAILNRQPRLAGAFILGGSLYALVVLAQYFQFLA